MQHREIRDLLARYKKNEFEERIKGMIKKEEGNMMMTVTDARDESVLDDEGTPAVAFTNKATYVNAFMNDVHATIPQVKESKEVEVDTQRETPGFATADQIRNSLRRRSDAGQHLNKRKRDVSIIEVKAESSTDEQLEISTPNKRNRLSKNPLTPHTARQIAQNTNTAPAKLAGRKMMVEDNSSVVKRYHDTMTMVKNLDVIIGTVQVKLRDDVDGAEQMLITAKSLIGMTLAMYREE